ncbi:MAG: FliM/FliN family flagellar motor switch protein [Acidobacteriota bacterium]
MQKEKSEKEQVEVSQTSATEDPSSPVDGEEAYARGVQRILDIELPIVVYFGSSRRPLREIISLVPGAVLEMDTPADEPAVLRVNNKIFARGSIVEVNGYYGIEITEIDPTAQRIACLGGD